MGGEIRLRVVFYKTKAGEESVREWLKSLPRADRKTIGEDIKTVQFGWPLGTPLIRKLCGSKTASGQEKNKDLDITSPRGALWIEK